MNLYGILLMAGNSIRFGGNKLLYEVDNKKMYEYGINIMMGQKEKLKDIIVVTQYHEIEQALAGRPLKIVKNFHSERGISSSIHLGLEVIPQDRENAYFFLVGDQPYLSEKTVQNFIEEWKDSGKGLGCAAYKNILGNPSIFSEIYRQNLMALKGDTGGKAIIKKNLNDLYLYQVTNKKELEDIDQR